MSMVTDWLTGKDQRDAINQAQETANANASSALSAQEKANKEALDFQKLLTWLQLQQSNQGNAQSLAAMLSGQQQGANQFAQMYNQEQTNRLPFQMSNLAALQALTPLMQMTGLQGYQIPATLDVTPMRAPNVMGDFTSLADYFQKSNQQQMDPRSVMAMFSNPAKAVESQKVGWQGYMSPAATAQGSSLGSISGAQYPAWRGDEWGEPLLQRFKDTATQDWIQKYQAAGPYGAGTVLADWRDSMTAASKPPQLPPGFGGTTGGTATPTAPTLASLTPVSATANPFKVLEGNPEYDYLHSQAQRTLANKLAARGMTGSGAAMKMATDTTLGMAREETDRRRKQLMDIYALSQWIIPQSGGTQAGQTMANIANIGGQNLGQALNQAAQQRSGLYSQLGQAGAQSAMNMGNSLGGYYNAMTQNAMNAAQSRQGMTTGMDQLWSLGKAYAMGSAGIPNFGGSSPLGFWKGYSNNSWMNTPAGY